MSANTLVSVPVGLNQYIMGMYEEINGPFNSWVTGITIGRPPSSSDKFTHYLLHGGVQAYRAKFAKQLHIPLSLEFESMATTPVHMACGES
jgi:hypothetical protein